MIFVKLNHIVISGLAFAEENNQSNTRAGKKSLPKNDYAAFLSFCFDQFRVFFRTHLRDKNIYFFYRFTC